jgi:hypothetical protein
MPQRHLKHLKPTNRLQWGAPKPDVCCFIKTVYYSYKLQVP